MVFKLSGMAKVKATAFGVRGSTDARLTLKNSLIAFILVAKLRKYIILILHFYKML